MGELATTPVLDSDVLIDYLRGAGPGRDLLRRIRDSLAFRITAVTAFEVAMGSQYARGAPDADALLSAPCLMLSREAALRAGAVLRQLRAEGRPIDVRDAMQAGICLHAGGTLVTRNIRHFSRVPGLQVVEPAHWRA